MAVLLATGAGPRREPRREPAPAGRRPLLGYVPAGDLAPLDGAATVVAYLSRHEGSGLPPLEPLACGAAALTTTVGALPETLDEAPGLVPSSDPDALLVALRDLLADGDRRWELAAAGPARTAPSTWGSTARATLDVHHDLGIGR